MRIASPAILLTVVALTGAWDETFKTKDCYKDELSNLDERMPINLGNLVGLIEKWEKQHTFQEPDDIANALVHRYRVDGYVYKPDQVESWGLYETEETDKQATLRKLFLPASKVPDDIYEPREECAFHFLTSHSTDIYPHNGVDEVWENTRRRKRRQALPQSSSGNVRYSLPNNIVPAKHPIENGVMRTPSGPVAVGTLLQGIMSMDRTSEMTLDSLYGDAIDLIPEVFRSKRLHPQHCGTLAGDIGQSALVSYLVPSTATKYYHGPEGLFGNSTAAPKLFTLKDGNEGTTSYLSRAEIFAGIDALLIMKAVKSSSASQLKLSHILRMYYSDHGLPGYSHYKACNRMNAFKEIDTAKIEEQALNFMYAYSIKFNEIFVSIMQDDEAETERRFQEALSSVWNDFRSFVDSYDYSDYDRCPIMGSKDVNCENQVDLLFVYSHEGGQYEMDRQRAYLTHLSQMLGVGEKRSRLAIIDGKSANWMYPMTNFTNVADWGSNFTTDESISYGSGSDMAKVFDELIKYYNSFYAELHSDANNAEARSQVVLWNVPSNMPWTEEERLLLFRDFRLRFPDVYFLMVGKSEGNFQDVLINSKEDFFKNNFLDKQEEAFAKTLSKRVCQIPSVFVYPACDTTNVNFTNYREQNHEFTGFVSPNFTTYIHIAPHNFRYSGYVKLIVNTADVQVCTSRENMNVDDQNDETYECKDGQSEFEWWNLCGRWLDQCKPIYLAVKGTSIGYNNCIDERCEFPNQVEFELRHEGMVCGAWSASASLLLVIVASLVHFLRD